MSGGLRTDQARVPIRRGFALTETATPSENLPSCVRYCAQGTAQLWRRRVIPVDRCLGKGDTEEGDLNSNISNVAGNGCH